MIKELTGTHVLIIIIAFFGTIFTMNGFLVYFASSSWTGLEVKDPYGKGLKYNTKLAAVQNQNLRGWSMSLDQENLASGEIVLMAKPKDNKGQGLSQLDIMVEFRRPTHEGLDRSFALLETEPGSYQGQITNMPLGKWYLLVTAKQDKEVMYKSKNVLILE